MTCTNYFKTKGHTFFFVDTVPESVEAAWAVASLIGTPSVYRAIETEGPWSVAKVIGELEETTECLADL